jgi:hypothetical protein
MRHKTIAMTERYAHLSDRHLQAAVERAGAGVPPSGPAEPAPPRAKEYVQ